MKKYLVTFLLAMVLSLGFTTNVRATDFSVLEGTWDITVHHTGFGTPGEGLYFPAWDAIYVLEVTEWNENAAIGYIDPETKWEKAVSITWNSWRNQFKMITNDSYPPAFYLVVVGNYMSGTYCHFDSINCKPEQLVGTKRIPIEPTCHTDKPWFNLETSTLILPTVCIDGKTFENITITWNPDGTCTVQQVTK